VDGGDGIPAMNGSIDPARVLVMSIGIERYGYGSPMDLPGAAAEAMRFARWAAACGVPPERILLGCSWLDADDDRSHAAGFRLIETSQQAVENAVVEVSQQTGDLLLVFWCGHGLVSDDRRVLFTSDARIEHLRALDVDRLLRYLRSNRLIGFDRQVLLIDACANFVEDVGFDSNAVTSGTLPVGDPRERSQFVLFAAAQGQAAHFDRLQRHGTFSDTVLTWLEQQGPDLQPDLDGLARHVEDVLESLRGARVTRQRPVWLWYRSLAGHEAILRYGGMPVSGAAQAALRRAGMTVAQLHRIARAVAETPTLATLASRQQLLNALDGTAADAQGEETALIEALSKHLAKGDAVRIFDVLRDWAATDEERLAVHAAELCWRRQEWIAPALEAFDTASGEEARAAYYRVVPASDSNPPPKDLDEAMDLAAAYGRAPAAIATLHRLVARLEHRTGTQVNDAWFDLPAAQLRALRVEATVERAETARLVIDLHDPQAPAGSLSWPATVLGHLYLPDKREWKQTSQLTEPTADGARQAIDRLLSWAYDHGLATFTLGLIVSRPAIDEMPETWEFGDVLVAPTPLWRDRPTVLHCAERLRTPRARARWQEKLAAIRQQLTDSLPEVLWIEADHRDSPASIRDAVTSGRAACFGLGFATHGLGRDLHRDPLIATIAAGAPYVVWAQAEPEDWQATRQRLLALTQRGDFAETPVRLHEVIRAHATGPCNGLRLIWDEPKILPPLGQLTGFTTGGERDV
jgi:hypothetical protein